MSASETTGPQAPEIHRADSNAALIRAQSELIRSAERLNQVWARQRAALAGNAAQVAELHRRTEKWRVTLQDIRRLAEGGLAASVRALGQGIAGQLVDGTYEWRDAWKAVLRQMVAATAQLAVMKGILLALDLSTMGGASAVKGGGFLGELIKSFHRGGYIPRAHTGLYLRRDEVPVIAERGEFILRRRAVEAIGVSNLERMNRAGSMTSGAAVVIHGDIHLHGTSRQQGEAFLRYLQQEAARGRRII